MALLTVGAQYSGTGAPTSVAGQVGDQYHDTTQTGSLYICVTSGNPGTWEQVSGGSSTIVEATDSTINVTEPVTGTYSIQGGYVAGSNITITGNSIAATGGGGFTGFPSYTINLDSQSDPYLILNNLPPEIVFTTTGVGASVIELPNYTMETEHTYLPLILYNSPTSTASFNLNSIFYPPGASVAIFPTTYSTSSGNPQFLPGPPVVQDYRVNSGTLTVSTHDNNLIIYLFTTGGSANIDLPNTSNLPTNFNFDLIISATAAGSYVFVPSGSDTISGNNGLTNTITLPSAGLYFANVTYTNISGPTKWVFNLTPNLSSGTSLVNSDPTNGNLYGGDGQPTPPSTGTANTTYGENAGAALTGSSQYNTLIGHGAGGVGITTQNRVTAIGQAAAANAMGNSLIAIGPAALNAVFNDYNIGIGDSTLTGGAGSHNVAVGYNAGAGSSSISVVGNTMVGDYAGGAHGAFTNCAFFGMNADVTVDNLSDCGAFGYNTKISISNCYNFGDGTIDAFGFNNPSPTQGFDPIISSGGSTVWAYKFPVSTQPTTTSKGNLWMNSSNKLNFTNPAGQTFALNGNQNLVPTQIFQATGNITILNTYGQTLLLGVIAAGNSVIMPDPTVYGTSPWATGYVYTITVQYTNGASMSSPLTLLNFDMSPIFNPAGTAVTMQPGDTWLCVYVGPVTNGFAWPIGNIAFS